jgi:CheY-like chemotaxis protein
MKVLLIEDDPHQVDSLVSALTRTFEAVEVRNIQCEGDVYSTLEETTKWFPDLVILDMMLPWGLPSADTPPLSHQAEVDGYGKAGHRILERLRAHEPLSVVPVLFHTVISEDAAGIPSDPFASPTVYLGKDASLSNVLTCIRSLVPAARYKPAQGPNLADRLLDASEAQPRFFGFSIDLKKLLSRRTKA